MTTFEGKQGYMDPDAFNSGQEMYLYFIHVIDGWMPDTLKNMWDNGTSESEDYVYEKLIEAGNPGIKHD